METRFVLDQAGQPMASDARPLLLDYSSSGKE